MYETFILLGLIASICSAPVTTTEKSPDGSGGRYANFKQEDIIGRGSFADVYKMLNPENRNEVVAAKCPLNPRMMDIFKKEKEMYEKINANGHHVNIVQMLAYQDKSGPPRFFFKLHDGTLDNKLNEKKNRFKGTGLPLDDISYFTACNIVTQLLNGMRFIHNINIIHRDISLPNIMISKDDNSQVVLIDFGLAVFSDPVRPVC